MYQIALNVGCEYAAKALKENEIDLIISPKDSEEHVGTLQPVVVVKFMTP